MSDSDSSSGADAGDKTFAQMVDRMDGRDTSDEEGSARKYSVDLDDGSFSVCARSKHSAALAHMVTCFADYEPPFDSDQTAAMFEELLLAIARGEGEFDVVGGSRHRFVGGTLVQVADRFIDASLRAAEAIVWGELLVREGATCLRRISDDELLYVQRRDNGDAVIHARIARSAGRVVVACCSVDCDLLPATRTVPLEGYVLAESGGACRLTWVREADVPDASAVRAVLAANNARITALAARCANPEPLELPSLSNEVCYSAPVGST